MQVDKQLEIICYSYKHFANIALDKEAIISADFALVSHGTEADPIFNYANKAALDLFEMSFEDFTKLPSRLSARNQERNERARLLSDVKEKGFSTSYKGIRVSSSGKLFLIEETIVCNLLNPLTKTYAGQSALIKKWTYL